MNFTVYKSSAGSGKTYTLVKEYLKIALQSSKPDNYRGILAITFTNKATSEMKERILSALKMLSTEEISDETKSPLRKNLMEELNINEETLRARAKNTLTHILHHYSDFSISTIDKFVYKVVRAFARDLHIPINFEVELDSENLLRTAIDKLISKAGTEAALTKILVEFTERKTDEEKSWNIENDLKLFAAEMLKEEYLEYSEKLKELSIDKIFKIKDELFKHIRIFESEIKKTGKDALVIIANAGVSHSSFAGGVNGIGKYFSYLAECRADKLIPSATVQKYFEGDKWFAGKIFAQEKENISGIKNSLTDLFVYSRNYVQENSSDYFLFQLILQNIYSLAVLRELELILDEIKAEKNIVHISEFNKRIAEIVSRESAPFIYERLGEKYHHFLIDEFQDTSTMQWQNLLPLVHNSLSEGKFNMVVGDGKQAIYRWRSGDVEQFSILPQIKNPGSNKLIAEREQALQANFNPKILGNNFRSKKEIVEFNNHFFGELLLKLNTNYQDIYKTQKQNFKPDNTGGFVNIEIFREEIIDDIFQKNLDRILEIIRESQRNNFQLSDICILCRKNDDASSIATFLLENNVDVISSESLLISKSADVIFLISFLNFLSNPSDKNHQTAIAVFLIENNFIETDLSETLHSLNDNSGNTFFLLLLKKNGYDFSLSRLQKLPLYELVEGLIRNFSLNKNPNPYISFFLEFVQTFVSNETSNLSEFIEYWEKKKQSASIIIPDGVNAVRIMTIHKSKGLEFPIVIFPFANWQENTVKDFFWIDVKHPVVPELQTAIVGVKKDLEQTILAGKYAEEKNKSLLDNFNLLYVAFTRAKEQLYVLSSVEKQKNLSKHFIDILQKCKEWNEEKYSLQYGTKKSKTSTSSDEKIKHELQQLISSDWREKVYISSNAEKYTDSEKQKNYGKLLHYALSLIHSEKDVKNAMNKLSVIGICSEEEKNGLTEKIKSLLSNPQIKIFFQEGPEIKTETEILLSSGETYRPDRVLLYENSAIIIDYKTGKEKEIHREQIENYAKVLQKMNYEKIEKYLIYTEDEKVVKVV